MGIEITIKQGADVSAQEIYGILRLRAAVFIVEFGCIFLDQDNQDLLPSIYQLMAKTQSGELAGYLRLDPHDESVHVKRVVVAKEYRDKGTAREMMNKAIFWCRQKGYAQIILTASTSLSKFYASLDFVPVGRQFVLDESNALYQDMKLTF